MRFDLTAVCDTNTRPVLAEIFASSDCILHQSSESANTDSLVAWSSKRRVRIGSVTFNKSSDVSTYEDYLVQFGDTVRAVRSTEQTKSQAKANSTFMTLVASHCRQIEMLELEGHVLLAGLREVLSMCTKLHTFSVSNADNLNPQCLRDSQCPQIRTLNISYSNSAQTTAALLKAAPSAETVSLQDCELQVSTEESALHYLSPHLRCLYLNSVALSDTVLISMVDLCPCIAELHLKDIEFDLEKESETLSFNGVEYLAEHVTQLSTISLAHCNLIEECLTVLVTHRAATLTSLTIVECCEITIAGLNTALTLCLQLTHFHIRQEWNHTDLNFSLLAHVTNLQLELRSTDNCRKFLAGVSLHCVKLQYLIVEITDRPDPTAQLNRIVRNCTDIRMLHMRVQQYEEEPLVSKDKIKEWQTLRPRLLVTYNQN